MVEDENGSAPGQGTPDSPDQSGSSIPEGNRQTPLVVSSAGRRLSPLEALESLQTPDARENEERREQMLMEIAYAKAESQLPKQGRNQTTPEEATKQLANAHRKQMDRPPIRATHRLQVFNLPVNRYATFTPAPRPAPKTRKKT